MSPRRMSPRWGARRPEISPAKVDLPSAGADHCQVCAVGDEKREFLHHRLGIRSVAEGDLAELQVDARRRGARRHRARGACRLTGRLGW